jgi:hypothetical protein
VIGNPFPLANVSSTELTAEGSFSLTCSCPPEMIATGGTIALSIVPGQSMTRNGLPSIMLPNGDAFSDEIVGIPYRKITNYAVNVSAPNGDILQAGNYFVAIKFELSAFPQCQFGGN